MQVPVWVWVLQMQVPVQLVHQMQVPVQLVCQN
jgi:hypothetical protein